MVSIIYICITSFLAVHIWCCTSLSCSLYPIPCSLHSTIWKCPHLSLKTSRISTHLFLDHQESPHFSPSNIKSVTSPREMIIFEFTNFTCYVVIYEFVRTGYTFKIEGGQCMYPQSVFCFFFVFFWMQILVDLHFKQSKPFISYYEHSFFLPRLPSIVSYHVKYRIIPRLHPFPFHQYDSIYKIMINNSF